MKKPLVIFGTADENTLKQMENCTVNAEYGVLSADNHLGYAQPVGATTAYKDKISLSGVGFDIACGNKAVKLNLKGKDIENDMYRIMNDVEKFISFGIGRKNNEQVDDPVLERIKNSPVEAQRELLDMASKQLGTVGSGNHYVDIFRDENDDVWIGVHFGSRGFGYKTTDGFIALSKGLKFGEKVSEGEMMLPPILFDADSQLGQDYIQAMEVAGEYAYAGRNWVCDRVAKILKAEVTEEVHNHHNFAWKENHFGDDLWVIRKGCTPARPGQRGFIGASMGGVSVIVEGVDSELSKDALYTTVHGAGRVISRGKAIGRRKGWGKNARIVSPGLVDFEKVKTEMKEKKIELRGAGADEAPQCYKPLEDVLEFHKDTIKILHRLSPMGVAMAGNDFDPFKD